MVNDQLLLPERQPRVGILDGVFLSRMSELKALPPEVIALALLGLVVYLGAAAAAYFGAPVASPVSQGAGNAG